MFSPHVDYFFDLSCPYAYLGSEVIEAVCARHGATLAWRPMLLGGVFRAIGAGDGPMATQSPARAAHTVRDVRRWSAARGVPLAFAAAHPMRTVRALRVLLGLPEPAWPAAIHALYRAYWRDQADLTRDTVIVDALRAAGIDPTAAVAAADAPDARDELRRRTDDAVRRGVFGAPAMFVTTARGTVMLWGQDRIDWVEAVLGGWDPDAAPRVAEAAARPAAPTGRVVEFWFDLSSPFAYLGSTQIERVAAEAGATVRWRPLLLGGLFRQLGTPDVPLLAMPEPKRRYVTAEMGRWARWWGVPFGMTSRFPLRTVTPLRLIVAAGCAPALIHRLFRAVWVEDLDLADLATLRRLTAEAGVDPAAVDRTADPGVKQALIALTAEAHQRGVFGVPTCAVGDELYWGQDRLEQVAAALREP
jgi:2-hydroxychromene-2-carboxylate isomerase